MTIPVPVLGDRILDTWGASVAEQLNRFMAMVTTADVSSNSTTHELVPDLFFWAVSGKQYNGSLRLRTSVSATNQACQVGVACPTGNLQVYVTSYGQGAPNTAVISRLTASGDMTGITATDGTTAREITLDIVYDCTADGYFTVRWRRGGSSGSTGATIHKGSGGLIITSA